nr:GntR family transcriptional regulator [Candidatus Pantoea persica]
MVTVYLFDNCTHDLRRLLCPLLRLAIGLSITHQLADSLAAAIHRGTLKPGKRLPAIRRVAQTHQIRINTVLNA